MAPTDRAAAGRSIWSAHRGGSLLTAAAGIVAGFTVVAPVAPAIAQSYVPGFYESGPDNTDPGLAIPERFTERQLPYGAQIGALWLYPSLQLDESLNDNIFAAPTAAQGDAITTLTGRTTLKYTSGDSTLDLQTFLAGHKYAIHPTEDAWEGSSQLNFAKPIHDDAQFLFSGDIKRLVLPRTDPTGLQGLHPTTYEVYDGTAGLLLGHSERNSLDLRVGTDRTTYDPRSGS